MVKGAAETMSNSLRRMLAKDDAIIFVGSGVSRWSGLPSWEGLISQLACYLEENDIDASLVRQEAANGDLLQAASYGFMKLTPPQVGNFMRRVCRTGEAVPGEIHRAIMALGPSCFMTTNYDDLLEQAYRQSPLLRSGPLVVLNTQLLEQAEIIHAQARHFIFKPHGDACQADSVVLTREQYRKLLPEGPLSATLNTFKTLLQSRPVMFVGFGLRDPDFLYLRDILANIYRGGMRDHYAIVADPVADQKDYWQRHYGIHLVGYATTDGGRDHSALQTLLESLRPTPLTPSIQPRFNTKDAATVLALARYAAGCLTPGEGNRFIIRVSTKHPHQSTIARHESYDYWPVDKLLLEGPKQVILLGEPGAGKSFAIREAVNAIASMLQDACLRGEVNAALRIPILVDLKLFNGDLEGLIGSKFPEGLSLDQLYAAFPVILFLDGYNEMPRAFREDGSFDRQFGALVQAKPDIGFVIGSRSTDGLERLAIPICSLAEVTREEVERQLAEIGEELPVTHRTDIVKILQRPFYFRLLGRAVVSLNLVSVPADLYRQFLTTVESRFIEAFGNHIDLIAALQQQAYEALVQGSEAFALRTFEGVIADVAPHLSKAEIEEIPNWLASEQLIVPLSGHRAAFVHQSVTEYLAACEVKAQLEQNTGDISSLVDLRRWDNALFLTLSMLEASLAAKVLREITAHDIDFAIKASRFIQCGGEELIDQLLDIVATMPNEAFDYESSLAFASIPLNPRHEEALRRVLLVPSLRSAAYMGLARLAGSSAKDELIDSLFTEEKQGAVDALGRALSRLLEPIDIRLMVERLAHSGIDALDQDHDRKHRITNVAEALQKFSLEEIRRETVERLNMFDAAGQRIVAELVCNISYDRKSVEGMSMLMAIARTRLPRSLFNLYCAVAYDLERRDQFLPVVDDEIIETVIHYIDNGDRWSVAMLASLSDDERVSARVFSEAEKSTGTRHHLLKYCAKRDPEPLFAVLEGMVRGENPPDLGLLRLIEFAELDWSAQHDLLIAILARRDVELAQSVLPGGIPPEFTGLERIDLGDVEPWLDWLSELTCDENKGGPDDHQAWWVAKQLAALVAQSCSSDNKAQLLHFLDQGTWLQKDIVARMILPMMEGLLSTDLSPDALTLLTSLIEQGYGGEVSTEHVFALVAEEEFLRRQILPIALKSTQARRAVTRVARAAGERLGIRLVPPSAAQ